MAQAVINSNRWWVLLLALGLCCQSALAHARHSLAWGDFPSSKTAHAYLERHAELFAGRAVVVEHEGHHRILFGDYDNPATAQADGRLLQRLLDLPEAPQTLELSPAAPATAETLTPPSSAASPSEGAPWRRFVRAPELWPSGETAPVGKGVPEMTTPALVALGVYAGGGVAVPRPQRDAAAVTRELADRGILTQVRAGVHATGAKLYAGWWAEEHWGLEGAWVHGGEEQTQVRILSAPATLTPADLAASAPLTWQGLTLQGMGRLQWRSWSVFAKTGPVYWWGEREAALAGMGSAVITDSGWGWSVGAGASHPLWGPLAARVELERYLLSDVTQDLMTVGMEGHFP
ncbi:MAG: hypothetical protein H7831_13095 [Magnetococcus sp. WYHC-3]